MQYPEFKNYIINKAYIPYLQGDYGAARTVMANIFREGAKNPRATVYQINSSAKYIDDYFTKTTQNLIATGQKELAREIAIKNLKFGRELAVPKHPLVKSAYEELKASFKQMYPSKRTRRLSQFIMAKEHAPFIEKLKFLTRFL